MTVGPPPLWIPFSAPPGPGGARLGGKAAGLHRLTGYGLPVPPGFTLTAAAFRTWLAASVAGTDFASLFAALRAGEDLEAVTARAGELRARARAAPVPEPVARAVAEGLAELGPVGALAVRSSGSLEDGAAHSFAGLYETHLDVEPGAVAYAARECWLSLLGARALAYLRARGLDPTGVEMAVAVQAMVPARYSGVCFGVDPVAGREDQVLVEVAPGRGDALVSGRVTPSRLRLSRGGELRGEEHPPDRDAAARAEILATARDRLLPLVRDLEGREGRPLDVEFAWGEGGPQLLQARPITRLSFPAAAGEWTNADFNEGGVSAGPCCPFMWSLYDFIWRDTLPEYLYRIRLLADRHAPVRWARTFFGVPYWNVGAIKRCLRRVPGFDERAFDEDLGIHKDYPGGPWKTPVTIATLLRAIPVLVTMYREFGRQRRAARALLADFPGLIARYRDLDPADASDEVLFDAYRRLITADYARVEGAYFMTIFNSSNAKLEWKSAYDGLAATGRAPPFLDLMSGMRGLKTLAAVHELYRFAGMVRRDASWRAFVTGSDEEAAAVRAVRAAARRAGHGPRSGPASGHPAGIEPGPEAVHPVDAADAQAALADQGPPGFREAFAAYLAEFGHHSRRELDPRVPRWHEEPGFVFGLLRAAVEAHDPARDPEVLEGRQAARYRAARAAALAALRWRPVKRWVFRTALDRSREYCWLREELRDRSTRVYDQIRRYALEVARRLAARGVLADPDDLFYLPFPRQLAGIAGNAGAAELRAEVAAARAELRRLRNFRPPGEIGAGLRGPGESAADRPGDLRGVGGAPGRARGVARVIRDLAEADRVRPGDILVAEFTDPGWTPLLDRVSAVVTEVGGVLSHAAVIAREYGVPAVLSVRGATRRIPDGAAVEVDGDGGTVRLLPSDGAGGAGPA